MSKPVTLVVQIEAEGASRRSERLRSARDQVSGFLDGFAPILNGSQIRFMVGELVKNTLDHNDRGAMLVLTLTAGGLSISYAEPLPDTDIAALLDRMVNESQVSRLAGNGVNFGVGFNLLRASAVGLGMHLYAAAAGQEVSLGIPGWDEGASLGRESSRFGQKLVFSGYLPIVTVH